MAKNDTNVSWEAARTIWWSFLWRMIVAIVLQDGLDRVFDSVPGFFLVDGILDIWMWQWAIRASLKDRYSAFSFHAENKKTGQSIFGADGRVGLYVTFRIWWGFTWRTSIVPTAVLMGAAAAALIRHEDFMDFVHDLDSPVLDYFTLALTLPVSLWAMKKGLADQYRTFRFRAVPKSFYSDGSNG